ncbi:WD40 repeat-like protein [Suillus decipiens]|nr:WD40 repeat-like protein [Suillus decipiens]
MVTSVSFSPDGAHIVSGSWDETVRLWDAVTGEPVGEPLQGHTNWVNSVSFSPDGTRIVTGSSDETVRLWNTATRQPSQQCAWSDHPAFSHEPHAIQAITTLPLNSWNNHLVRFSPHSIHALRNTSQLMEGASHDDRSSTPFVLNCDNGWMIGPKHRLLFWVPPASRHPFYSARTALVIPRGGPELDLSRMAHGQHWQQCREE